MDHIEKLLKERNLHSHLNEGILLVTTSQKEGTEFVKELLYRIINQQSLLLLSGGSTPKKLYEELAKEERVIPGGVLQIDERFGAPLHKNSNQKMMEESGILRYFQMRDISFYKMLTGVDRIEAALRYDATYHDLLSIYQKAVGVLGIGSDGHTAGIAGNRADFKNPLFEVGRKDDFVSEFDDLKGSFKERVTLTFTGLSMLDLFIVMVFGDDKKEALKLLFEEGSEEEIPAKFYKRPEIAKKTVLITDQRL